MEEYTLNSLCMKAASKGKKEVLLFQVKDHTCRPRESDTLYTQPLYTEMKKLVFFFFTKKSIKLFFSLKYTCPLMANVNLVILNIFPLLHHRKFFFLQRICIFRVWVLCRQSVAPTQTHLRHTASPPWACVLHLEMNRQ